MAQRVSNPTRKSPANSVSHRDLLAQLLEATQLRDHSQQERLFGMIKDRSFAQKVRIAVNTIIAKDGISRINEGISSHSLITEHEAARFDKEAPISCPGVLDVSEMCSNAPYKVPAKPWTTITDSDDLVSHLVSLYLTWGYPFYAFFCHETFLKHMSMGKLNSDFCSPFLVNALLANACFFADYLEAYSLPGDVKRLGVQFLAEAERHLSTHQLENGSAIRVSSLQAILLLYERYSLSGQDNYGYTMLHRAISMAESMGIINNVQKGRIETAEYSEDMKRSLMRTAWGLFQIDTIAHVNFLKENHVKTVNLDRIPRNESMKNESWIPYPLRVPSRQSYLSIYFDEACSLSYIAKDASSEVSHAHEDDRLKQNLISRLREWEKNLPAILKSEQMPAAYVLILRMRYATLIINICCHDIQNDISFSAKTGQTPLHQSNEDLAAAKMAASCAREIASLVEIFKKLFGLERSHQFVMYAINVSLFCLLTQPDFNFLDRDFLSLTKAFSIVSCRSQVGRHLFHALKLTIRKSVKEAPESTIENAPPTIKEFFGPREDIREPDEWDRFAAGLAEADGDRNFLSDLGMDPVVPSLNDMLRWYERLSVGREVKWNMRGHKPDF